ncbi:MAG: 3',5'-cyclic-nucleotide phosphodiesterase [Ginsengibacter sp.]
MKAFISLFCFILITGTSLQAQQNSFKVIPLGVKGGSDESNLSSYMLAPQKSNNYICLDAGTLYSGIRKAISNGVFHQPIDTILRNNIRAYLISHGHLDHIAGMVLNSPDDSHKNIYGTSSTIEILKNKYFTWESWANFADQGEKPTLNKYHYIILDTLQETAIDHTDMYVTAFTLSHGNPYKSTAFLVRHDSAYILYLGDTGADEIEKSDKLQLLWQHITPLIQAKKLKGIFIEVSFPNEQPDNQLFGHLTPKWLMTELNSLSELTGKNALKNFPIAITHIKPIGTNERKIKQQLSASNNLQLKILYPKQGILMKF